MPINIPALSLSPCTIHKRSPPSSLRNSSKGVNNTSSSSSSSSSSSTSSSGHSPSSSPTSSLTSCSSFTSANVDFINDIKENNDSVHSEPYDPSLAIHQHFNLSRPLKRSGVATLYPGSQFQGTQTSGKCKYNVTVNFHMVDLESSTVEGYLRIENLTKDAPEITTFFDGEIVGKNYSFLTNKWNADMQVDGDHWSKFPPFSPYILSYHRDDFEYDHNGKEVLFMRWKEHFLANNHKKTTVDGASFTGFYYICLSVTEGKLTGFYYHIDSERYQLLELSHSPQNSFSAYEFR